VKKGDVGGALAALTAQDKGGQSALSQVGDLFKPKQQQQMAQVQPAAPPPMDETAALAGPSQQLFSQALATAGRPLSWSTNPYGSNVAGPRVPGTTLNSMGIG
jgi:hypothetical protein